MQVESIIQKALASEVSDYLNIHISDAKEIFEKKVEREIKKYIKFSFNTIFRRCLADFFLSYEGRQLIKETLKEQYQIKIEQKGGN